MRAHGIYATLCLLATQATVDHAIWRVRRCQGEIAVTDGAH